MRRRNKPVGKAAKTRSRRKVRRPTTAKIARPRKSSGVDTAKRIALLEHRLNEALEQQAASSEVLKVISSSPGELEPIFQAILANATGICEAKFCPVPLRKWCVPRGGHAERATGACRIPSATRIISATCWNSLRSPLEGRRRDLHRRRGCRNQNLARQRDLAARGPLSPCRCARKANWSARS